MVVFRGVARWGEGGREILGGSGGLGGGKGAEPRWEWCVCGGRKRKTPVEVVVSRRKGRLTPVKIVVNPGQNSG